MKQIGGIYIFNDVPKEEATCFGIYIGRDQVAFVIKDEFMYSLYEDVENGGMNDMIHIPEYTFGISTRDNTWHIKDKTKGSDDSIIVSGTYHKGKFDLEVKQFVKQMTGL